MLVVCLRWLLCFGKMEKFEIYFRSPVRQRLGQKRADLRSASLCRCNPWSEQNGGAVSEWRIRRHCLSNWPPACRGITPASAKNTCATVANPGSTYAQRNNRRHAPRNLFMSPTPRPRTCRKQRNLASDFFVSFCVACCRRPSL